MTGQQMGGVAFLIGTFGALYVVAQENNLKHSIGPANLEVITRNSTTTIKNEVDKLVIDGKQYYLRYNSFGEPKLYTVR